MRIPFPVSLLATAALAVLTLAVLTLAGCSKDNGQDGGYRGQWLYVNTVRTLDNLSSGTITPAPEKQTWLNLNRDSSYSIVENGQTKASGTYHMLTVYSGQSMVANSVPQPIYLFFLSNGPLTVDSLSIPDGYQISTTGRTLTLNSRMSPGLHTTINFSR